MTEKMRRILTVLLAAVFVVSTVLLIRHSLDTEAADESYLQAQQIAGLAGETEPVEETAPTQQTEPPATEAPTVPEETVPAETEPQTMWVPAAVEEDEYMKRLAGTNLDALRETNPGVVGWIYLPNTKINYPIVQGEDNQYYLDYTWNDVKSVSGSIFLEATNAADFSDFRSILYGHNMADGSMFGALHNYAGIYYWQAFPYVYLVTDEGILRYEIYSCYNAAVDSATYALNLGDDHAKSQFIQMTVEESELKTEIVPAVTDRILTLSTCTGNYDYRRVVHARLVMEEVEIKNDSLQEDNLQ